MSPTKKIFTSVVIAIALGAPATALANHPGNPPPPPGQAYGYAHDHTASCTHAPAPPPRLRQAGGYELQTQSRWVEGRFEKDWVPEQCRRVGARGKKVKCTPGYWSDRWVPGHRVQVQQWVWVPAPKDPFRKVTWRR